MLKTSLYTNVLKGTEVKNFLKIHGYIKFGYLCLVTVMEHLVFAWETQHHVSD